MKTVVIGITLIFVGALATEIIRNWRDVRRSDHAGREDEGPAPSVNDWAYGYTDIEEFDKLRTPLDAAERYASWCYRHRNLYVCPWPLKFHESRGDGTEQDLEAYCAAEPPFTSKCTIQRAAK